MADLRIALIGRRAGWFVEGFRSDPRCVIGAVCEPDPAALEALGQRAGVPHSGRFRDYEALLEEARPDAVMLGTPMPLHVPQAVQALDRGVHVLSEVTAAVDLEQCRLLVAAVRRSPASYMMAENYCYRREAVLVRAMAGAGLFGECYFAEGEYLHDVKSLHAHPDGRPTWRATWQVGKRGCTYGTHALGPALEFFGPRARVATVACTGSGVHTAPQHPHDDTCLMLCTLTTGGLIKVRVDMLSNRPTLGAYYALQGTKGCYEAPRGFGDEHKVWLSDEGEAGQEVQERPAGGHQRRAWRPLWDYAERYLPPQWKALEGAAAGAGHGGGDFFVARDFAQAILDGRPPPIDVYRALDYTLPGLISERSILQGGAPLPVPDPRELP